MDVDPESDQKIKLNFTDDINDAYYFDDEQISYHREYYFGNTDYKKYNLEIVYIMGDK